MSDRMSDAERFFYKHAGFSVPPGRRECARELARAEQRAADLGLRFCWGVDEDAEPCYETCDRAGTEHQHEILYCLARDAAGTVLASLGAIIDPDRNYARVVEAELADEALADVGPTFPK